MERSVFFPGPHFGVAMKITAEVRALAMEQAGRRCECTGKNCRHHLSGARCKRGLRGDDWKVFWRKEDAGATPDNIAAWCLECFGNNFTAPRETIALLAADIVDYHRLLEGDRRKAITLKSVLRDAVVRAASKQRGRMVLDRLDDDILVEFATSREAVEAARGLGSSFQELALRLDLPVIPELSGAIHYGDVIRWRNGFLAGDGVEITTSLRRIAGAGQIVLTGPAASPLDGKVELEPIPAEFAPQLSSLGGFWGLRL